MAMTLAAFYLAQAMCAPYQAFTSELQKQFGEVPVSRGALPQGRGAVELLVSPSGSFTVIAVMPDGSACLVIGGDKWKAAQPGVPS